MTSQNILFCLVLTGRDKSVDSFVTPEEKKKVAAASGAAEAEACYKSRPSLLVVVFR